MLTKWGVNLFLTSECALQLWCTAGNRFKVLPSRPACYPSPSSRHPSAPHTTHLPPFPLSLFNCMFGPYVTKHWDQGSMAHSWSTLGQHPTKAWRKDDDI